MPTISLKNLFSSLFASSPTAVSAAAKKYKPLVMQTYYSANNQSLLHQKNLETLKLNPIRPFILPDETLLEKQKNILMNKYPFEYTSIENIILKEKTFLLGLSKHQPILGSVFMYGNDFRYSLKWNNLINQAEFLKAGIAVFEPKQAVKCLKLNPTKMNNTIYFIHSDAIKLTRWLLNPLDIKTQLQQQPEQPEFNPKKSF